MPPPDRPRKALRHETAATDHRVEGYWLTGDALDAIQKGFRALADAGHALPPETIAWVEACESVKARFPKPPVSPASED